MAETRMAGRLKQLPGVWVHGSTAIGGSALSLGDAMPVLDLVAEARGAK